MLFWFNNRALLHFQKMQSILPDTIFNQNRPHAKELLPFTRYWYRF